jgi:hypothetical protein
MARPKLPNKTTQTFYRISEDVKSKFDKHCADNALRPGKILEQLITSYLEQNKKPTTK